MNWDQIEIKWVEMTRRVRGDCDHGTVDKDKTVAHRVIQASPPEGVPGDRQTKGNWDAFAKSPSQ